MRKIIAKKLMAISIFNFGIALICNAQDSTKYKYNIDIDYNGGNIKVPIKNLKPKNVKVGSFIFISLKNLPSDYKVTATATFENGNLENGTMFNSFLNRDLEKANETNSTNTNNNQTKNDAENKNSDDTKPIPKENQLPNPSNKSNNSEIQEIIKNEKNNPLKANEDIANERKYIIDIFNLPDSLKISTAEMYFKNIKEKDFNDQQKLAYEDILWQKYALKIANNNIKDFKKRKDSVILSYAKTIDDLNSKIEELSPKTKTKNLIGIQILNSDYTNINVEIKDEKNNIVTKIPFAYNNIGGFKLDFSVGFFNALYETFNYKITNKENVNGTAIDSVYRILKSSNGKNNISFGILAHAYWRVGQTLNPGFSSGFTYTPASKNLNYLIGFSALLGRQQRFIITSGLSYSKINDLQFYIADKDYHKSIVDLKTNLTYNDKLQKSFFFGVSYNLGNIAAGKSRTTVF